MPEESEFQQLAKKLKSAVDSVESGHKQYGDRLTDIEQKVARRAGLPGAGAFASKGFGDVIVDSDEFKALAGSASQKGQVRKTFKRSEFKTINPAITSASGSGGGVVAPDNRFDDLTAIARQGLPIRALLGQTTTASNTVIYPRQVSRSLNAAGVAETALKPQSDVTFADDNVPIRTLAHWFRCSRQIMDDAPAFRAFLNAEAEFGLRFLEEMQFLYGDGTGQNLLGMIPQASALTITGSGAGHANSALDQVLFGAEQVVAAALPADAVILNPTDWLEMLRVKDTQGRYLSSGPFSTDIIDRLWNLTVCTSLSMTPGTFLVGSFQSNVQVFDREELTVMVSTEDQNNFVTNQVTILAEERTALTVLRPTGLVTGQLHVTQ